MATNQSRPSVDSHLRFPWREQRDREGRRLCAWPGCACEGQHRAPRSRDQLRDYIWFCLDHVREYNRGWDYFAGMDSSDIDAHRRADVTWHRPTWGFGAVGGSHHHWHDPFGFFEEEMAEPARPRPPPEAGHMMAVLGLELGFTLEDLKRRYKIMVKRFHPDLHGGDKAAEERLRRVIEAYTYLRDNGLYAEA
jgi:hypothetical protein